MAERPVFGDPSFAFYQQKNAGGDSGGGEQKWLQHRFLDRNGLIVPPEQDQQELWPEWMPQAGSLQEAIAPWVDVAALRQLAAEGQDIRRSFRLNWGEPPAELATLLEAIKTLLRPPETYKIRSPNDLAAYLMVDMGFLDQEQFKVACLDTRNQLQAVPLVYQGNLNTSVIRMAEIFRFPIRFNSAAIIPVHNHPSGDPTPSPEDEEVTREIVAAARILGIEPLDHLVIGQGRFASMKELGLM